MRLFGWFKFSLLSRLSSRCRSLRRRSRTGWPSGTSLAAEVQRLEARTLLSGFNLSPIASDPALTGVTHIALDPSGNIYVSTSQNLLRVTPDGSISPFIPDFYSQLYGPQFADITGLACDLSGNLYVANKNNIDEEILMVTPQGTVSPFVAGVIDPVALTSDASDNLYIMGTNLTGLGPSGMVILRGNLAVPGSGTMIPSPPAPAGFPSGLAANSQPLNSGHSYVAVAYNDGGISRDIFRVNAAGASSLLTSGRVDVFAGMAFDSAGNLFIADGDDLIWEIPASGVESALPQTPEMAIGPTQLGPSGVYEPSALASDSSGNLYIASIFGEIVKATPSELVAGDLTPPSALEGQAFSDRTVFHFTDDNAAVTNYTAVVALGDGNTVTLDSSGVVSGSAGAGGRIVANSNGGFDVQLSYTYAEALSGQTFSVSVSDAAGGTTSASTSTFSVADAALTATATPVTTAVFGKAFSGEVATFVDANPLATLADFPLANAAIQWGDGRDSSATSITQPDGPGTAFHVFGSHTYGAAGATATPLSVTITDADGAVSNATSDTPTVAKANATVVVTPYSGIYDGTAHTASYTITGVGADTSAAGTSIALTSHTNAGTYSSDTWSFSGGQNYNDIAATTITDVIGRAAAKITIAPYDVTYDANSHTATGTATGVLGESLTGLDLSGTTHTEGATYSDNWMFNDPTGNYNTAAGTVTDTIGQAAASITVNGYTGKYDGHAHGATGSATGVIGEDLGGLLNLGASFANVPGGIAGWVFAGNTDYKAASGSVAIVINKADAVVAVTPYGVTYDGKSRTATGTATGVLGEALAGLDLSGTTHTDAGGYGDTWTFTDTTGNYNDASGTLTDAIGQANAKITVNGYTGKYDGHAHGATGSATGVIGEDLGSLLNLGASFTNVPGGTANWSFAGNTDYKAASGSVAIVINKADAVLAVTPYSVTYDGNAHAAKGTATGVLGESLAGLDLTGTTHTHAGSYSDGWTFTDTTGNYNNAAGTVKDTIGQANANITVTGYTGAYDGHAHGATGSATGVQGENLNNLLNLGTSFTNVPGGMANWSFAGNTDYKAASGSVAIVISKAGTTTTLSSSLNTPAFGQSVTFTAIVTNSAAVQPTGRVDFYDGRTLLGSGNLTVADGHSQATFSAASLAGGVTHSITAAYSGDGNNQTSTSAALSQTVLSPQQQTTSLISQVNSLVSTGVLSSNNGNALTATLNGAIADLNGGNKTAGVNQLNAFIKKVQAFQKSGLISVTLADALITSANQIVASVGV
jgi:hypothetical protein